MTVVNGQGSGSYYPGDEVTITADSQEGMTFAGWTADTDAVWFADASAASTTFSMPAAPVTVTAQYTQDQDILIDTPEETSGEEPQTETSRVKIRKKTAAVIPFFLRRFMR